MSNYYYDEKTAYLAALAEVRQKNHDLTPFLIFGLKGIAIQSKRLSEEIRRNVSKALFRDVMYDLFTRLESKKKRVIAERQIEILKLLLRGDAVTLERLIQTVIHRYSQLQNPDKALTRDLAQLLHLKAISVRQDDKKTRWINLRLEWPTEITETDFFERVKSFPKAKTRSLLP